MSLKKYQKIPLVYNQNFYTSTMYYGFLITFYKLFSCTIRPQKSYLKLSLRREDILTVEVLK